MLPITQIDHISKNVCYVHVNSIFGVRGYTINMNKKIFIDRLKSNNNSKIQDIFPDLTDNEREFLISGLKPEEFDKLFI